MSVAARSAADLLSDAREVAAVAGGYAAEADEKRGLDPKVVEVLAAGGFSRWFIPHRWGGDGGGFSAMTAAVTAVGEQCASTAWLASILAYSSMYVTYLPEEGQADVWGKSPNAHVVTSLKPLGTAVPVDGGWRLSGAWPYVSGIDISDWALLSGPDPSSSDEPPRFFAVPREDYSFHDTWSSVGMRGTASHTLIVNDAFVPEYHTCMREDVYKGRNNVTLNRPLPVFTANGLAFVVPVLGAARGGLAAAAQSLAFKPKGPRAPAGQVYPIAYARSAGEIDAAQLLLERCAETGDTAPLPISPALVRRSRRDAALALDMLAGAVDRLFRIGGTRAQAMEHPLQRIWRDVNSVAGHAVMQFEPAALEYAQGLAAESAIDDYAPSGPGGPPAS